MKPHIEAIFKKVESTGNLSDSNIGALINELNETVELFEHITKYVPDMYLKYLIMPNHKKAIREMRNYITPAPSCNHELVALGPVAVDRDTISNHLSYSILKQCKLCKDIKLEPAEF